MLLCGIMVLQGYTHKPKKIIVQLTYAMMPQTRHWGKFSCIRQPPSFIRVHPKEGDHPHPSGIALWLLGDGQQSTLHINQCLASSFFKGGGSCKIKAFMWF